VKLPRHCGTLSDDGTWTGTVAAWWYVGPLLVDRVTRVKFMDFAPGRKSLYEDRTRPDAMWYFVHPSDGVTSDVPWRLPCEWFGANDYQLRYYHTEADALADASHRAIEWARKEAGL